MFFVRRVAPIAALPNLQLRSRILCRAFSELQPPALRGISGKPVSPKRIAAGDLGHVSLDTNIISNILNEGPTHPWIEAVLQNSKTSICQFAILEYLTSSKVQARLKYEDVLKVLEGWDIKILDGPCASSESSEFAFRVLGLAYERLFPKPLAHKTPKALKQYGSAFEVAKKKWSRDMPAAWTDLALACEGHINGYSFLTSDFKFIKNFKTVFNHQKLTVYCIRSKGLENF
ncbi:hypothetical protein TWF281_011031 [Arthrobotrys megalospora]